MYCDGELAPEQVDEVDEQLRRRPQLRVRVEFEKRLRRHVDAVLRAGCPSTPAGLADRIRTGIDRVAVTDGADDRARAATAGRVGGPPPATTAGRPSVAAWLRGPHRANMFAVAASLALVAGAVLFGIFGSPIDSWNRPGPVDLVADAVPFVAKEHIRCAESVLARTDKATFRTPDEAGRNLSQWLGATVNAGPIAESLGRAGWDFLGGGHCCVPTSERSCHLIFTRHDPSAPPVMLSIFVLPDHGGYAVLEDRFVIPVEPGRWHQLDAGEQLSRAVWICSDRELVYLMVVCAPEGMPGAASALEQALAPAGR
ncbi:MAG: anti-sigma factor family protein [Planctomycetota bacterium]